MDQNRDKTFDNEAILILGGSGLLGSHCYEEFKNSHQVVSTFLTHPTHYERNEYLDVLGGKHTLIELLKKYRPKVIINSIGFVSVEGCESSPKMANQLNVEFVQQLVEAINEIGLQKCHLVHVSSDSVYGRHSDSVDRPWSETDSTNPISVYAKTKLEGERKLMEHNGPYSIIRTAFYGISPYSEKSLLSWIISNARQGKAMDGWDNVYFSPLSAKKLAQVIRQFVDSQFIGIYNVGSLNACNKYDFIESVCSIMNLSSKLNRVSMCIEDIKTIRPYYSVLNVTKLSKVLAWNVRWQDDLSDYISEMTPKLFIK